MAPTTETRMPTTGSAVYEGHAIMTIGQSDFSSVSTIGIVGDTSLTATFAGAGTVKGQISGFEAVTGAGTNVQTLVPASGEILIGTNDSFVGATGSNNAWAADYEGEITVHGNVYTVDNVLLGLFLGNTSSNPDTLQATRGVSGTIETLSTHFAETESGGVTPFAISVFGEVAN